MADAAGADIVNGGGFSPPHGLLEDTRATIEDLAAKMLLVKEEGRPKSELRELVTQMSLSLITLRQVNRLILVEEDKVKEETEKAKAPVDFTTLQLHNLTYEKNHYLKAIKACRDFRSKYPSIELVSEEEFFRDAPDDIKGGVLSSDGAQDLMLKRLNYEFHQRKELCKLRETLEQRKKELVEKISDQKKFLSSLPSHLKSLKKASLPVQQRLEIFHTKKSKQNSSAELLPPLLYIIYSQLLSQKEAFGESIELEILGSIKEAQNFAHQHACKDSGTIGQPEVVRLDEDLPDEDDEGQRRRKRPKKTLPKDDADSSGMYQSHPLCIILHIFNNESSGNKPSKLISLKFEFLVKLNVVCVGVEGSNRGSENILCNLFPDDTGIYLPHQAAKIYAGDNISFMDRSLRPYKWAQHLGGMDILPETPPLLETVNESSFSSGLSLYRHQHRAMTFLQRIRSRKESHMALEKQLESLSRLTFPSLSSGNFLWTRHSPACTLEKWSALESMPNSTDLEARSAWEEGESMREDGELPSAAQLSAILEESKPASPKDQSRSLALMSKQSGLPILGKSTSFRKYDEAADLMIDFESDTEPLTQVSVDLEDEDLGLKGCRMPWEEYATREFVMVLSRCRDSGRKMNLVAKIGISVEHPLRPPYFSLSLVVDPLNESSSEWFNELRVMEAEVNVYVVNMVPPEWDEQILSHQIRCLAMLFDLSIDQPQKTPLACQPMTGSTLARSSRGRDRRKLHSLRVAPNGTQT